MSSNILSKILLPLMILLVVKFVMSEKGIREKLYLTFPKGTVLAVQICMTSQMGLTPGSIFTEALNWGINYPLEIKEEESMMMMKNNETSEARVLRRERRSLFSKVEKIIYRMGYDGKHCVLRAICEYASLFKSEAKTFENELLKIFFEYTSELLTEFESREDVLYHNAQMYGKAVSSDSCFEKYHKCNFSLLHMLLGNYSPQISPNFM